MYHNPLIQPYPTEYRIVALWSLRTELGEDIKGSTAHSYLAAMSYATTLPCHL